MGAGVHVASRCWGRLCHDLERNPKEVNSAAGLEAMLLSLPDPHSPGPPDYSQHIVFIVPKFE